MNQQTLQIDKRVYHHLKGVLCLIGYGACGQGLVPLLKRHLTYDKFVIIDPYQIPPEGTCDKFYHLGLTQENFTKVMGEIFQKEKGFCVNFSFGVSSNQLMEFCQTIGVLYIDSCNMEFPEYYTREKGEFTYGNYGYRYNMNQNIVSKKYKTTAISCCGANPGMVNWFLKKALIDIAHQTGFELKEQPKTQQEWGRLMKDLGVKGLQVAQRDTQNTNLKRPIGHFWNTWSIQGFIGEGFLQRSQLGWGTHQKWFPPNGKQYSFGSKSSIYLSKPGMCTQVRSWCPTPGPQIGYLITHDESNSIAQYFSLKQNDKVVFRPTVMYAYHPCDEAILSINDLRASCKYPKNDKWKILKQEIVEGCDELGVLVYGHGKNAYWYGSNLSIDRTRKMAPNQNATVLQVTSAMLAGIVWAIENPEAGTIDTNQMDYKRCLQIQSQYIQQLKGVFTDWTPITSLNQLTYKEDIDETDPWQFKNILFHE